MIDYSDVYMTPEQAAEKLQLAVETIYRWLRSGKLRGSRISHKAWRISEREIASFMRKQNVSEMLFEEYVAEHRLGVLEHQPTFPGTSKLVDYCLRRSGQQLWFEVKEFDDDWTQFSGRSRGFAFDPYVAIRRKIAKAVKQFRDYDGECCSLVLFNERANLVDTCTPSIVLGAMLGPVAWQVMIDTETGKEVGPGTRVITRGGMLLNPHTDKPRNRTISAVIALERFAVGHREFRIKVEQKEIADQSQLGWQEEAELMEADRAAYDRMVLRSTVYENPHALRRLPKDTFTGPFDERWGQSGDLIAPVYTGAQLARLRSMEHDLGLDAPFGKYLKAVRSGKRPDPLSLTREQRRAATREAIKRELAISAVHRGRQKGV